MNRINLVQYLIDKFNYKTYLEIGTEKGESFFPIRCRQKIAVDPEFKIELQNKLKWYFKNLFNLNNKYFEMTSDRFFEEEKKFLRKKGRPEIILIDGLHTFKATLQDALNSLHFLQKDGIIILHDCFPPHKAASISARSMEDAAKLGENLNDWTGEWCGDSWKAIVYLRMKYPKSLKVKVFDSDYGLGVVRYTSDNINLNLDRDLYNSVDKLRYEDLIKNPQDLLGLTNAENYTKIL